MVNRQKKALGWVGTVKTGYHALMGKDLSKAVNKRAVGAVEASPSSYKKGGKVKRTGKALVHKGEVVLTASKVKMLKKLLH
jgi:hypothetical protein